MLIAFTFSGAASRFDARRVLIVDEANAICTAWLRIDLVAVDAQPALRDGFRRYVGSRLVGYQDVNDEVLFRAALARSVAIQKEIWALAVAADKRPDAQPAVNIILLLPALNAMTDISLSRAVSLQMHQPGVIFALLIAMAMVGAVLAGMTMSSASSGYWLHHTGFAVIMAVVIYVIVDLEHPRLGQIRVDSFDRIIGEAIS